MTKVSLKFSISNSIKLPNRRMAKFRTSH